MGKIALGVALALAARWAGRWLWRRWRYDGDRLPSELARRSS